MEKEQPEQVLSEKQLQVYQLFSEKEGALSVSDIDKRLKGAMPKATIKQALSRLFALRLIERIGMGRSTRYRLVKENKR